MSSDYEHLTSGWREVCELLAGIRDQLERNIDSEISDGIYQARMND